MPTDIAEFVASAQVRNYCSLERVTLKLKNHKILWAEYGLRPPCEMLSYSKMLLIFVSVNPICIFEYNLHSKRKLFTAYRSIL